MAAVGRVYILLKDKIKIVVRRKKKETIIYLLGKRIGHTANSGHLARNKCVLSV